MNQIQAMRVFTRVAETQSFRRAAQQLNVSNALVTRSIATLEAHLNTRLINRTTRNVSLTEAGYAYLQGCRRLLEELDFIEATVVNGDDEPRGTLRVAASTSLGDELIGLVEGFRQRHGRIRLHVTLGDQAVDALGDNYDVGLVQAAVAPGNGLSSQILSSCASVIVASPNYLLEHVAPQAPNDLPALSLLAQSHSDRSRLWHLRDAHGAEYQLAMPEPVYVVNNAQMLRAAAVGGMGIALLPQRVVERDVASGRLVQLLPDCEILESKTTLSVVYPERQYMAAKTRAFVEFVCARYGQADDRGYDAEQGTLASQQQCNAGRGMPERQHPADAMVTRDNASGSASSTKSPHATAQPASRPAAPWPFSTGEWRVS
jgi:DNA-binding transcriptional LysR family regulator